MYKIAFVCMHKYAKRRLLHIKGGIKEENPKHNSNFSTVYPHTFPLD